jgi:hypothetical protein
MFYRFVSGVTPPEKQLAPQQLRQLGDIDGDAVGFVARQQT